ncbi:MAG: YARHG domain-containing protein, partial [Muribaculaceae bacterium]|nr:YARHG domain-containing protein [Muribaculaceae bacterium]
MKRMVLAALAVVLVLTAAMARNNERPSIIIPGNAHIDVEKLQSKNSINLNMDVSKLNLYEIRILRAAMAARQGDCIMQSKIRRLFDGTSWYTKIAEKRYGCVFDEEGNQVTVISPPISYTARE